MSFSKVCLFLLAAVSPSLGAIVRVDSNAPVSNPNHQANYQTLNAAVAVLKDGDELLISPGIYHESLKINGRSSLTIKAAGDGVVIDGTITIPGSRLNAMVGGRELYSVDLPTGDPRLVFVDGHLVMPRVDKQTRDVFGGFGQGTGPLISSDTAQWIWDSKARQLQLNLPAQQLPQALQVTGREYGIQLNDCRNVHIQGIALQGAGTGIDIEAGSGDVIQNCLIRSCMNGIMLRSNNAYVRYNTIVDNDRHAIAGGGQRNTIEENYLNGNGHDVYKTARFYTGGIKRNHGSFEVVDYNLILDQSGASFWGDLDCIANLIYGNSIALSSTNGFYLEWTERQNNVSYNSVMDCGSGIMFRCSQENMVLRNWFFDHTTASLPADIQQPQTDHLPAKPMLGVSFLDTTIVDGTESNIVNENLIQVSGAAVSVAGHDESNTLAAGDTGITGNAKTYNFGLTNQLLGNYYTRPSASTSFAEVFGHSLAGIDELKRKTGWETNAHVGQFSPDVIWDQTPLWWPVPFKSDVLWMPLLFNGRMELRDRGNRNDGPMGWQPSVWSDDLIDWTHWSRYGGLTPTADGNQTAILAWRKADDRNKQSYLEAIGLKPNMAEGGVGWRSILLPALPGTTFSASIDLKWDHLQPLNNSAGIRAGILFINSTGRVVGQKWLTPANAGDLPASSNWKTLQAQALVPADASRVQWYLGLDAITGTVDFTNAAMTEVRCVHSGAGR